MKKALRPHTIVLLLSTIAIVNALYLTYIALYQTGSICDINEVASCSSVFAFSWSWILGVPFPAIAMVVYPVLVFLAWKGRDYDITSLKRRKATAIMATMGICFNLYFLTHEVIDNVYCPLCIICLVIIITISIMSWRQVKKLKKLKNQH